MMPDMADPSVVANQRHTPATRATLSLDGAWEFQLQGHGGWRVATVPGPWQAEFADLRHASGVATYRRSFDLPASWQGREVAVRFGAASYFAEVSLNGTPIGSHEGGYLPFEIVLPEELLAEHNQLEVRVTLPDGDASRYPDFPFAEIPHGKQSWYGPLGGLWQSVTLEARDRRHIVACRLTPDLDTGSLAIAADIAGTLDGMLVADVFAPDGEKVASAQTCITGTPARLAMQLPQVLPWSPDHPHLYRLALRLRIGEAIVDAMDENFGFRSFVARDGHFRLNGEPFYLRGALDQDYYPDGICTPPSLGFLEDQLRKAKALGLNCLRCHIKVPDPRYYAAADRLGMLIWTEIPNVESFTARSAARLRATMEGILARDGNHPAIVVWTLINEDWGTRLREAPEHRRWLAETFDWLKQRDPTRLVVDNSPCAPNYHIKTDINDFHYYRTVPERRAEWDRLTEDFAAGADWTFTPHGDAVRSGQEPLVVSEFGVWGLPDPGRLRQADGAEPWWFEGGQGWADGAAIPHGIETRFTALRLDRVFGSFAAFVEAAQWYQFNTLKYEIESMRRHAALGGYVITEFTDVHWEANGLLDLNRNPRVFCDRFAEINADVVILPGLERWAYWAGETLALDVRLAAGGRTIAEGSQLSWRLGDEPVGGEMRVPGVAALGVAACGPVRITLPAVAAARMLAVHLHLSGPGGEPIAVNRVAIAVYPRRDAAAVRPRVAADDPAWAERLAALGYPGADLDTAEVIVTATLDAARIDAIRRGARVLLLADTRPRGPLRTDAPPREPPLVPIVDAVPGLPAPPYFSFPGVGLSPRDGTIWRGDWITNFSWIRRDGPFAVLPGGPLLDLGFDRVVPHAVITDMRPWEYDRRVHAGVVAGWVHKPAATIFEKPFGDGNLLATTFRLAEDAPGADPTATVLLDALISLAAGPAGGKG